LPLWRCYQHMRGIASVHTVHQGLEKSVGANRRRAWLHNLIHEQIASFFQCGRSEPSDNYTVAVDYRRYLPWLGIAAVTDFGDGLSRSEDDDVLTCGVGDTFPALRAPLDAKAGSLPIGDAADVIVDSRESEAIEPARGSWGHVSQPVVAIDHYRFASGEVGDRLRREISQRYVLCTGQVHLVVLTPGEDIDD
jgi:hypothetical protein